MIKVVGVGIILLLILLNLYGVVVGVRDGVISRRITGPDRTYEGRAAFLYGWFCILGGLSLALLGVWALRSIVNN